MLAIDMPFVANINQIELHVILSIWYTESYVLVQTHDLC